MQAGTKFLSFTSKKTRGVGFRRALPLTSAMISVIGLAACQKKAPPPPPPPQAVGVVTIQPQDVKQETVLPGRTEAFEQAQIRPQVGGLILKRTFEQGADVKVGQLLYQINPAPFQASYDQARAQLLHAEAAAMSIHAQLDRYKPLAAAHAVSRQDYDNTLAQARSADADIAQAKANVESARVNLDWTSVRAPIDGRIGRMLVTPGTLVTPGQTLAIAVVTRLDPIYVDVNLADTDMLRLRREMAKGQLRRDGDGSPQASLVLDDGSTYEHPGKLKLSEVTIDPATGTLVLRAEFPNPDKLLLPGLFVHASIDEGVESGTLLVPQIAVARDTKGEPTVFVVGADDKVESRHISVGRAVGTNWVVTDGLKAGDRVVVEGVQKVKPGASVAPHDAKPANGAE